MFSDSSLLFYTVLSHQHKQQNVSNLTIDKLHLHSPWPQNTQLSLDILSILPLSTMTNLNKVFDGLHLLHLLSIFDPLDHLRQKAYNITKSLNHF